MGLVGLGATTLVCFIFYAVVLGSIKAFQEQDYFMFTLAIGLLLLLSGLFLSLLTPNTP